MSKRIRTFKCFSNNLKVFLMSRGLEYVGVALDPITDKTFWLFIRDDKLDELLSIWTNNKSGGRRL